ncbi:hypothetical protein PFDG_04949 [Plasmodium falciparum Dd2]|uniref:Uncharacterized protein n=1 Tax=Plasmodium falciparum (isolate Dd2) TaxID=57267 RepID=A0A0L7M9Z3_PLAF4|nr:hypothetical protein PFDG_04949 [Plasmodium falciparum Dd2]
MKNIFMITNVLMKKEKNKCFTEKMNMIPNYLYNNDSYNDEYFYYDDDDDNDNDNIGNNYFYNNNVLYRAHYQYDNDNKNSYLNYYLPIE